ncbi:MAG: dual specificity protein phosphatase family protein [Desulfobacteraceae bacterium]|nr:dual specificity protein phosphatase family protein [Desulfobacteraceae bacterium]
MPDYNISWVTSQLAVGRAPMSYAELDLIRAQGIDAIINLCAEFSDLHELEEGSGFEVFYLPVWDDEAPAMEEMETGLAWLDEAIYLGKKVLVHCRHGIGRSGTLVSSYLLRKGLDLKGAAKKLKLTRAAPTSPTQKKLLKRYGKRSGTLTIREPSLEHRNTVDLTPYIDDYEALIQKISIHVEAASKACGYRFECGSKHHQCCFEPFEIQLIEAICLHRKINRSLTSDLRETVIAEARNMDNTRTAPCPLFQDEGGVLHEFRPIRCRIHGVPQGLIDEHTLQARLTTLSSNVFLALSGRFPGKAPLGFSIAQVVSGKFIEEYFQLIARLSSRSRR